MEVVFRNGLGLGGIEIGGSDEVVGEGCLGHLFCFPTGGPYAELCLRRPSWGMEEGGTRWGLLVEKDLNRRPER